MEDERKTLSRGILWIGSATAVARATDALSLVLVLRFLSREEIGMATLAWTVTVFVECFNGLGIGTATLQAPHLSREQISSAFWYAAGIATCLTVCLLIAAPFIAAVYDQPLLAPMIQLSSLKLLCVGLAAVPLSLVARALRYRALGAISTLATLSGALVTLAMAATGYGAWAPLAGNLANGACQLIAATLLAPHFSRSSFAFATLKPLARTGAHVAGSVATVQLSRNLDYLLLGRLVGVDALGGYRVAFDLAMAPSIAILQVGNRTALPLYAGMRDDPTRLVGAWLWTLRTVFLMVFPVVTFVFLDGELLLEVLGKGGWSSSGASLRLLCVAALLRGVAETYPSLFVAAGKSQLSLVHALTNLALVASSMTLGLSWFAGSDPILVISAAWLGATALLVIVSLYLGRTVMPTKISAMLSVLTQPALLSLAAGSVVFARRAFFPMAPSFAIASDVVILLFVYGLGLRVMAALHTGPPDQRRDAPTPFDATGS